MIYCECNPDEELIRFVCPEIDRVLHRNGKHWIAKQFKKNPNLGAAALVDEDPDSNDNDTFHKLNYEDRGYGIKTAEEHGNRCVVLSPRLEEWILAVSLRAGINVEEFGLPSNGKSLHKIINLNQEEYRRLLARISRENPVFQRLRGLLLNEFDRGKQEDDSRSSNPFVQ